MEVGSLVLWSLQKGFTDSRSGLSFQVDAVFLREGFTRGDEGP